MTVGIVRPSYPNENRVALLPKDMGDFPDNLLVEKGIGKSMAIPDDDYMTKGCRMVTREEVFSPWRSRFFDPYCRLSSLREKERLYCEYGAALRRLCEETDSCYVDPDRWLDLEGAHRNVLVDHIHPDAKDGIRAFSLACASYSGEGLDMEQRQQ